MTRIHGNAEDGVVLAAGTVAFPENAGAVPSSGTVATGVIVSGAVPAEMVPDPSGIETDAGIADCETEKP